MQLREWKKGKEHRSQGPGGDKAYGWSSICNRAAKRNIRNETDREEVAVNFLCPFLLKFLLNEISTASCVCPVTVRKTLLSQKERRVLCVQGKRKEPLFRSRDQKKKAKGTKQRKKQFKQEVGPLRPAATPGTGAE